MPKKRKKLRKPRLYREGKIYISPDGGETVYEQKRNGNRGALISQSELAKDIQLAQEEIELHGVYAIQLRKKYPALEKAWDKYKLVWNLIHESN
jgi:hypothetical protein|tara:strand:- start:170 stop:451 length:282 start_codon:yes stop_codon:yes gene_type:complete